MKADLLSLIDWLRYCWTERVRTSYKDYLTLMWEEYCRLEEDPALVRGIDY